MIHHGFFKRVGWGCLLIACLFVLPLSARITQLNPAQCAQLELTKQQIHDRFRRGYSLKEQVKWQERLAHVQLQLDYYCQDAATSPPTRRATRRSPADKQAQKSPQQISHNPIRWQVSTLSIKAPYQGEQQQAWLNFYKAPFYCYNVRLTERIRQCVELRQQAQREFEQQWHQQTKPSLSDQ